MSYFKIPKWEFLNLLYTSHSEITAFPCAYSAEKGTPFVRCLFHYRTPPPPILPGLVGGLLTIVTGRYHLNQGWWTGERRWETYLQSQDQRFFQDLNDVFILEFLCSKQQNLTDVFSFLLTQSFISVLEIFIRKGKTKRNAIKAAFNGVSYTV